MIVLSTFFFLYESRLYESGAQIFRFSIVKTFLFPLPYSRLTYSPSPLPNILIKIIRNSNAFGDPRVGHSKFIPSFMSTRASFLASARLLLFF